MCTAFIKKLILPALCLFFSVPFLHGQSFIERHNIEQSLEFCISPYYWRGLDKGTFGESLVYTMQNSNFKLVQDSQLTDITFDYTESFTYYPFKKESKHALHQFGIEELYHFENYYDISTEHDAILSLCYKVSFFNDYYISFVTGWGIKATYIDGISEYTGAITDWNINTNVCAGKKWDNGFECCFYWGSHDLYRYSLFISPVYGLKAGYTFNNITFSLETELRVCDQFTTISTVDMCCTRFCVRYNF